MSKQLAGYVNEYRRQLEAGIIQQAYRGVMNYIMDLRNYFANKYYGDIVVGNIHHGYMDFTYFSVTPLLLKDKKLKVAIIFFHESMRFDIWLAGQSRQVQKKYWEFIKGGDWKEGAVSSSPRDSILESVLIGRADFEDQDAMTGQIEDKAMRFIDEIVASPYFRE
ncbi:hypothetical protein C4J81_03090 [Deltaproteobacteria bacterium Smac51]|nr:hypothetical protein C4J81_03090 [Deltaproteobacteria bacterium Smac51]